MSNSSYYKLFRAACLNLVRTMVVKFDASAECVNGAVLEEHPSLPVDSSDPSTWRYYQNMAGLYHETNTAMRVVSLDTLQEISFDKVTLQSHPATRRAYRYGSREHTALKTTYSDQYDLILGILYAPDRAGYIHEVIRAKDGTILYWDADLVESQEHSLILSLQARLTTYCIRWHNRDYARVDNLYQAAFLWQLSLHILQMVHIERMRRCRTHEAHSYHVRRYLASNGSLDAYMDLLTQEQILYLYRNILYLENHSGRKEVFASLVDNLLTQRGLPLYEYTMRHNTFYQIASDDNNQAESFTPRVYFKRKALNVSERASAGVEVELPTMLTKLAPVAPGNEQYHQHQADHILNSFQYSPSNVVQTKVLESVVVDNTQAVPYPLIGLAYNQWVYWASTGQYTALATLKMTGIKKDVTLSMLELLILWRYAGHMAHGHTVTTIEPLQVSRVQVDQPPGLNALVDVSDAQYVATSDLQAILNTYVQVSPMTTVGSFYQTVQQLFNATLAQERIQYGQGSSFSIVSYKAATERLYKDTAVTCAYTGQLYSEWLSARGISFDGYTSINYWQLQLAIFDLVTNYQLNYSSAEKEVQQAMMAIMSQLLSYSVLITGDMQESSVELAENAAWRVQRWDDTADVVDMSRIGIVTGQWVAGESVDVSFADISPQVVSDITQPAPVIDQVELGAALSPQVISLDMFDIISHLRPAAYSTEDATDYWAPLTLEQKLYLVN